MATSSQKFIARNRAPRVQIEYDVELYGAEKKIQLPFVMGVMADLSGASAAELPPVAERKFVNIDVDNFDQVMKSMKPTAIVRMPDRISNSGGEVSAVLTFEKMEDFLPGALARQFEPTRKLLEARQRLSHLITFMDGKPATETLMAAALQDKSLIDTLAEAKKQLDARRAAEAEAKAKAQAGAGQGGEPAPAQA